MRSKIKYVSMFMLLLLFTSCAMNNTTDTANDKETMVTPALTDNTENVALNPDQNEEAETAHVIAERTEDIQPSPRNVFNYVNEICIDFDVPDYDINELRDEASRDNENVITDDEVLLTQKMGGDIFRKTAEYFNISFQEAIDLFVEGAEES